MASNDSSNSESAAAAPAVPAASSDSVAAAESSAESLPEQSPVSAADLKVLANAAFGNGELKKAHELYTAAIKVGQQESPVDKTLMGILYCNRSITRFNAGEYSAAAGDAGEAMTYRPEWVKAIHRKATAVAALGTFSEAAELYTKALELEPGNKWIKDNLKKMRQHIDVSPVTDEKDWMRRYKDLAPQPIRMATLVHYWNICTKKERFAALARLSELANYRFVLNEELMNELPLERYKEIQIREQWLAFFSALDTKRKVNVLESMWNDSTDDEKQLIMHDLTYYFREGADEANSNDAEQDMDLRVVEESHAHPHSHAHAHSHGAPATDAAGHVEGCPNHGAHGHSHAHSHAHSHGQAQVQAAPASQ